MKRILHVVGARPNFVKIAPIMRAVAAHPAEFEQLLVHTGQHYDFKMSQVFFDELQLPQPDVNLEVGSGSHAWQTAQIMQRFEPVVLDYKPDWVVVPGDVNSTLACALVSSKLGIRIAHVEAGLRAFDRTMPEEINRVVADHLADALFTTEPSAEANLMREGINPAKIHFVGNVMIDSLVSMLPKAEDRWRDLHEQLGCDRFVLVTLHRPSNVDRPEVLRSSSWPSLTSPAIRPWFSRSIPARASGSSMPASRAMRLACAWKNRSAIWISSPSKPTQRWW